MSQRGRAANGMLLFLIYGMFALFSLLLVVIGAKVYRNLTEVGAKNSEVRQAFSYIANKVRISGSPGGVSVTNEGGIPVLSIAENYGGTDYITRIYYYDGALREQFNKADKEFSPKAGQRIAAADGFKIEPAEGGVLLTLAQPGLAPKSMRISTGAAPEVTPA